MTRRETLRSRLRRPSGGARRTATATARRSRVMRLTSWRPVRKRSELAHASLYANRLTDSRGAGLHDDGSKLVMDLRGGRAPVEHRPKQYTTDRPLEHVQFIVRDVSPDHTKHAHEVIESDVHRCLDRFESGGRTELDGGHECRASEGNHRNHRVEAVGQEPFRICLLEMSVALMKVLAAPLEHLGANPEEDDLALGGEVVVDAAQADVGGMRHLPHCEPLGP